MSQSTGGVKALLSTDIVDFSRLLESHEMRALDELDYYSGLLKRLSREYHGEILSNTGDTFLVAFDDADNAVACAVKVQEGMRARAGQVDALPMQLRVALHYGEIAEREGNYYGDTLATVLELRGVTEPGGISATGAVAEVAELGPSWVRGSGEGMEWYRFDPQAPSPGESDSASSRADARPEDDDSSRAGSRPAEARSPADVRRAAESSAVKTRLLREMKRQGRRLTLSEAYDALEISSPEERRALYNLAAAGFLARGERAARGGGNDPGAAEGSPRGGRSERRRRDGDLDESLLPSRRGVGEEREDREAESAWDQVLSRRFSGGRAPSRDPVVKSYREQTERSLDQLKSGFRGHLISYVGVNGMLITLGFFVGAMPWLAIPAMGWGIGLASHWAQLRERRREVRQLSKMRQPTREKLRVFRRLTKARNSWRSHLVSNGATSAFLFALNMMTSPGFPWFIFPVGGMAIGLLSHYPAFKSKERKLTQELDQLRLQSPAPRTTSINPDASPVEQAEELQDGILGQMEALGQRSDVLGEGFETLLTNYVEQVRALTERGEELDDILHAHSLGPISRELDDLDRKRNSTEDRRLQRQYDETMQELRKQKDSIEALMSEREMIALRINSGLNMLKNVRIELVRLKTASSTRDVSAGIEAQSKELLGQLEDLRSAYEELND